MMMMMMMMKRAINDSKKGHRGCEGLKCESGAHRRWPARRGAPFRASFFFFCSGTAQHRLRTRERSRHTKTSCASKDSLKRTGIRSTCGPISPYSGRDCVKSLRASFTWLYPQNRGCTGFGLEAARGRSQIGRARRLLSASVWVSASEAESNTGVPCSHKKPTLSLSHSPRVVAGSYLRLIDLCITQLEARGPSRTCNESEEDEEEGCTHGGRVGSTGVPRAQATTSPPGTTIGP